MEIKFTSEEVKNLESRIRRWALKYALINDSQYTKGAKEKWLDKNPFLVAFYDKDWRPE